MTASGQTILLFHNSFSTFPEELRAEICTKFLYNFVHCLTYRLLTLPRHLQRVLQPSANIIIKEHLHKFYLQLSFELDREHDPNMYIWALKRYGIPQLQRHWERSETEETRAATYKTALERMVEDGEWHPRTSIDAFIASHDLNIWSRVFRDQDTNMPNTQIWKGMFGSWVNVEEYGDPEGEWGYMDWTLSARAEGDRVVFKGPDDVLPFGFGIEWFDFNLTAKLKGSSGSIPLNFRRINFDDEESVGEDESESAESDHT
ncbi:hypothetical protein HDV00_000337 [Rhizophlyctis rosea]|nr:hypothetical protein HDV00_000337 [Rhizophlyctis rosea]